MLQSFDKEYVTSAQFTHKMLPREDWGFSRLASKSVFWREDGPVRRDNGGIISITLSSSGAAFRGTDSLEGTLRGVAKTGLVRSLRDPGVVDTKFVLVHSRTSKGGVVGKKALRSVWCSSHLLMELCPYFRTSTSEFYFFSRGRR